MTLIEFPEPKHTGRVSIFVCNEIRYQFHCGHGRINIWSNTAGFIFQQDNVGHGLVVPDGVLFNDHERRDFFIWNHNTPHTLSSHLAPLQSNSGSSNVSPSYQYQYDDGWLYVALFNTPSRLHVYRRPFPLTDKGWAVSSTCKIKT